MQRLVHVADPWQPLVYSGVHGCTLCRVAPEQHGKANLYVPGDGGMLYVYPELIAHYANAHGYRPPDEFCRAVLACPPMRPMPYLRAVLACGGKRLMSPRGNRMTNR